MFNRRPVSMMFGSALWLLGATGLLYAQTEGWDAFSQFIDQAKKRSFIAMASPEQVRASQPENTSIILLDPVCSPSDTVKLQRFIEQGGRLVLVAERPHSKACFKAFGLTLAESSSPTFEHGPILRLRTKNNFLGQTMSTGFILANHPRKLVSEDEFEPGIVTKDGEGIGFKLSFGRGSVIALSDSSLFINQMLRVAPNARLMTRLLDWAGAQSRAGFIYGPKTMWALPNESVKPSTKLSEQIGRIILICLAALAGIVLVMLTLTRMTSLMSKPGEQIYIVKRPELAPKTSENQTHRPDEGSRR